MCKTKTRIVFPNTALGLFFLWGCFAASFLAVLAMKPMLGTAGVILTALAEHGLVIATLIYGVLLIVSLVKKEWRKAIAMFGLGVLGAILLFIGTGFAMAINFAIRTAAWDATAEEPRLVELPNAAGAPLFSVEYKNVHPFLAEYDKTIVFSSGKRIGVWRDTGGAGAFAVYQLPSGDYYLVDGLDTDFIRNDYCINVTQETVEILCGQTWLPLPDNALWVTMKSNDFVVAETADGDVTVESGRPVGDSLKGRRYLGLISPQGSFVPGEGDPFAEIINKR